MPKNYIIRICLGVALLPFLIGAKILAPLSQPIKANHFFALSLRLASPTHLLGGFDWLIGMSATLVLGQVKTLVLLFQHSQFGKTALTALPELGSRMFHTRCTP